MRQGISTFYLMFLCSAFGDEILVQLNIKRSVNIVSERYVSFSVDPNILIDNINGTESKITDFMATQLSPAYLKISGNSFFTLAHELSSEGNQVQVVESTSQRVWKNFNDWIGVVGLKPVIPLPYTPYNWDSREALRILNISSQLGVRDCIWQLGLDFDATGASNYIADLITLETIVNAFVNYSNNWKIIGADLSAGSSPEETRLYADLAKNIVAAHGWMQPVEYTSLENQNNMIYDKDVALRILLNRALPVWLTLPPKIVKHKGLENCSALCIAEGLQFAQTLGDAAKAGFHVVFKPLDKLDILEPGFSYYISLLFKRTMGQKVFDPKIINGDRYVYHIYAHCAYDLPGAFSIMAINMAEIRTKIYTKSSLQFTGSEIWQYILTVNDGTVLLNGEPILLNSTLDPFVKIKQPNRPINLVLPPMSIGFWVIPLANVPECNLFMESSEDMLSLSKEIERTERIKSSSDILLQQLISEHIRPARKTNPRKRRHIVVKKDSNYLNQQLKQDVCNHHNSRHFNRQKRFVLKNDRPRVISHFFDGQNSFDFGLTDEPKRLKKSFPVGLFRSMDIFKTKGRRFKRQIGPLFRRSNFQRKLGFTPILFGHKRQNVDLRGAERSDEEHIFAARDNQNLPQGDIHTTKLSKVADADYDYIEADDVLNNRKFSKKHRFHNHNYDNSLNKKDTYRLTKVIPRSKAPIEMRENPLKHFGKVDSVKNRELEPLRSHDRAKFQNNQQQLSNYYMQSAESTEHVKRNDAFGIDDVKPEIGKKFFDRSNDDYFFDSIGVQEKSHLKPNRGSRYRFRLKRDLNKEIKSNIFAKPEETDDIVQMVSWSINDQDNFIRKDIDDTIYDRVVPFNVDRSYNNYQDINQFRSTQKSLTTPKFDLSTSKTIQIDSITDVPEIIVEDDDNNDNQDNDNEQPKIFKFISENVLDFMKMINHHVGGWWNSWA